MWGILLKAVWFILPAYVANSVAIDVSVVPFLKRFNTPVDFGRSWWGKRILGDGKTWRGLIAGVISGTSVGFLQSIFRPDSILPIMSVKLAFLLSLGALLGDMGASFLKRRSGFERGEVIPFLDQLDYIVGAFFFAWIIIPVDFNMFIVVAIVTLPLHVISNIVAWALKIKKVPW